MTFYNRRIAKNKTLMKAWRAGHERELDEHEKISLPEVCGEIEHWMRRHRHPRNRLSLRSFSVLLSGTIRLYRNQVNELLSDTFNCAWMQRPVPPTPMLKILSPETASESSELIEESLVVMPQSNQSLSSNGSSEKIQRTPSSEATSSDNDDITDASTVFTVLSGDKQTTGNCSPQLSADRRDQAVQTEKISTEEENGDRRFDPYLPFGYVLVHDNCHSRFPKKIILCNLNANVKYLQ